MFRLGTTVKKSKSCAIYFMKSDTTQSVYVFVFFALIIYCLFHVVQRSDNS